MYAVFPNISGEFWKPLRY